jgi:hypothetical protein
MARKSGFGDLEGIAVVTLVGADGKKKKFVNPGLISPAVRGASNKKMHELMEEADKAGVKGSRAQYRYALKHADDAAVSAGMHVSRSGRVRSKKTINYYAIARALEANPNTKMRNAAVTKLKSIPDFKKAACSPEGVDSKGRERQESPTICSLIGKKK